MTEEVPVEIRADSVDEVSIDDIWVAGMPFGILVENTEQRAKAVRSDLGERPDHVDDDAELWALVEQLQAEVGRLQDQLETDLEGKRYKELGREEKVRKIHLALVDEAQKQPTGKASMEYDDVRWLFNGRPSTGHCYDLMQLAGTTEGFEYEARDDNPNRLTVDLGAVNDDALVHAANNPPTSGGD